MVAGAFLFNIIWNLKNYVYICIMIVTKINIKNDPSHCNFCNKGRITESGLGLYYPYNRVYSFKSDNNSVFAVICDDCLAELIYKTENLKQIE